MPGRRRNPDIDAAIMAAGARALRAVGFRAFSIEGLAEDLRIPRSTIYTRWPNKMHLLDVLLAEALIMPAPREPNLRAALRQLLSEDVVLSSQPEGRAAAQLLLAAQDPAGPDAERVRARIAARREQYRALFATASVDETLLESVIDLIVSAVWGASVLHPAVPPPDPGQLTRVVLAILGLDTG